jgi:hypothetical protein
MGQTRILGEGTSFRCELGPPRKAFVGLFLAVWLCGWFLGETSALREIFFGHGKRPALFLVFWVVLWTVFGAFASLAFLFNFWGSESLELTSGELVVRRHLFGFAHRRSIPAQDVVGVRFVDRALAPRSRISHIAIESKRGVFEVARGFSSNDAKTAVEALRRALNLPDPPERSALDTSDKSTL